MNQSATLQELTTAVRELSDIIKQAHGVEQVPEWTADASMPVCDVSGSPCPEDRLIDVDGWNVHPTVAEMMLREGISPDDASEAEAYQRTFPAPMKTVARKEAKPRPTWDRESLSTSTRPVLMAAAKDVGLRDRCKEQGIDYRRETKEWIVAAVEACLDEAPLPKPESEKNLRDWSDDG